MLTIWEEKVNNKRREGYQYEKRRITIREEKVINKRRDLANNKRREG